MIAANTKTTMPLRLLVPQVRLKRYSWKKPTARKTRETLTSQLRKGSIAMLKPAIPTAAVRLSGRQQASVDSAVTTAATGITLADGFIALTTKRELQFES